MLPALIGGAIIGLGALMLNDASSSNKRAKKKYNKTYDKSVSSIKNSYYDAQQKDNLDKLYKVKKAKVKIANTIYNQLENHRKNFNSINEDIRKSKIALDYLFSQKRASDTKELKVSIQKNINAVLLSRKELFKIKDNLKKRIQKSKSDLDIANQKTQMINKEIKLIS